MTSLRLAMAAAAHERLKKRQELWRALTDFIQNHGGWGVLPPKSRYFRVGGPQSSSLPVRLLKIGYSFCHARITTHLCGGFVTLVALELCFIGKLNGDRSRHLITVGGAFRCKRQPIDQASRLSHDDLPT